jgi:hypothetical protein
MRPNLVIARNVLLGNLFLKGKRDELLANKRERIARDPELVEAFEQGLAEAGLEGAYRHLANIMAARLEESGGTVAPGGLAAPDVAKHYLFAGDYDRAMEWAEKAFEVHSSGLAGVGADPIYDPLRSNPRFQDLLRRMNLPLSTEEGK